MTEATMDTELGQDIDTEQVNGAVVLGAVDRASIDMQIATAKQYPRSVDQSLKDALTLATLDEETAASMFYALPRSGKTIEGPSARLAEIMAYSWGNLRVDADIVGEDATHVTAMGTCFDLEKNVAIRVRVKRRITDRHGKRFNEDMIVVTSNAAISIALRNSVFKIIPAALVQRIYQEARRASLGEGGTITQKRQKAMDWFSNLGISDTQVFDLLGIKGLDDIGEDHLITLRGLVTAIKDGETSVEQVFSPPVNTQETEDLNAEIKGKAGKKRGKKKAPKEDDTSPASADEIEKLRKLMDSCDLEFEEAERYEGLIAEEDGPGVRTAIKDLQKRAIGIDAQGGLDV